MRQDDSAAAFAVAGEDSPTEFDQTIRFGLTGQDWYPYLLRAGRPLETAWLLTLQADRFLLLADANLPAATVGRVRRQLAAVAPCGVIRVDASEHTKTLRLVDRLAAETIRAGATRRSVIAAMGGGLIGNVGGLLAALLWRGAVGLLHLPTTLLAASDSVLSHKDAVSVPPLSKNALGAFRRPDMVWADLTWLDSLPPVQVVSAMCEIVKNVVGIRPDRLDEVAALADAAPRLTPGQTRRVIELGIEAKTQVMAADPHERGDGLILEAGHTVGHALELLTGGALPHGHAVGIGLCAEAEISRQLGLLDRDAVGVVYELLERLGAPTALPAGITPEQVVRVAGHDNKHGYLDPRPGWHPVVLLRELGVPVRVGDGPPLVEVAEPDLLAGLRALSAPTRRRVLALA